MNYRYKSSEIHNALYAVGNTYIYKSYKFKFY